MILTVPPISDETQTSEPSRLNSANRGRASTKHVGDDPARLGVDEMRHIGRLRRGDEDLAIWTETHAFRFDPDLYLVKGMRRSKSDYRDRVVVLVRHVEDLPSVILRKQLGIWT